MKKIFFILCFLMIGCSSAENVEHTHENTCQYQGEFDCAGEIFYSNGKNAYCKLPKSDYTEKKCRKCDESMRYDGFCECGHINLKECRKKLNLEN